MRLLLVEDDVKQADILQRRLRSAVYAVDVAATCGQAEDLVTVNEYDLIVLDLMLPDGCGVDLLKMWRRQGFDCPTLMLTARANLEDKIRGLDAGADDYLTKPFEFEELLARLRTLLRRRTGKPVNTLEFEDLILDRTHLQVHRRGALVEITAKELALLEHFMLHPGKVLSRGNIAEHVWDDLYKARSNVIDVVVGHLRRKLEARGSPRLIFTIKGLGYVLQRPAKE